MKLLAFDTSGESVAIALYEHTDAAPPRVTQRQEWAPRQQTERILPLLEVLLQETETPATAIDAIAYGAGPGAFTGVRIAAATAQALALAWNKPLYAQSTLAALARQAFAADADRQAVLTVVDARQQEFYWAGWRRDADGLPTVWLPTRVGPMATLCAEVAAHRQAADIPLVGRWGAGSGWGLHPEDLATAFPVSGFDATAVADAVGVAELAAARYRQGERPAPQQELPVYVREDVWKKLPGR